MVSFVRHVLVFSGGNEMHYFQFRIRVRVSVCSGLLFLKLLCCCIGVSAAGRHNRDGK
jgi:hypothetical protein